MIRVRINHDTSVPGASPSYTDYSFADLAEVQAFYDALEKANRVASFKYDGGQRLGAVNVEHVLSVVASTAEEVAEWEAIKQREHDIRFGGART